MLKPSDEFRHERTAEPNWQENYVWHAWDAKRRSGWYFHLGHIPDHGLVDVRALVIINGRVTSAVTHTQGDDCLAAPGLSPDVITPLEHWKLRYDGKGARGPNESGWYGLRDGDVDFGFDVDVRSKHPAIDWAPYFAKAGWGRHDGSDAILPGQTEPLAGADPGNHYEQGANWKGRIWSGDESVEAEGLLIRDHSWGPRGWSNSAGFWAPAVLDDGKTLIMSTSGLWDDWKGFSILANENGVVDICYDVWVRTAGPVVPRQYRYSDVLRRDANGRSQKLRFDAGVHLPMMRHNSFLLDPEERFGFSHMYSTVSSDGHGDGFGTIQIQPSEKQVAAGLANPLPIYAEN